MREPNLDLILQQLREELVAILGDELDSVLLYGSQARGDAGPDSDIDVLVIMHGPFDHDDVWQRTLDTAAQLSLKYDTVISRTFVTREQFERQTSSFMLNVRHEAVSA